MKSEFLVIREATVTIMVKKGRPDVFQIDVDGHGLGYHFHAIRDSRTHRGVFEPYDPPTRVELIEGELPEEEAAQRYDEALQDIEAMRKAYVNKLNEAVERARAEMGCLNSVRESALGYGHV